MTFAKCTQCGRDMYPCDTQPVSGGIIPTICSVCRIDNAEAAREAKRAFYEEENRA